MIATITDAYEAFERMHGEEHPVRSLKELRDLIHEAGMRYEDISGAFWELAFGNNTDDSWAWGAIDWPTKQQWERFAHDRNQPTEDD
jgi:hypothetical protein